MLQALSANTMHAYLIAFRGQIFVPSYIFVIEVSIAVEVGSSRPLTLP